MHDAKGLILRQSLNANQIGGSGTCFPGKLLNLDLLKSPETCMFLFIMTRSKFSRRATKLLEKGYFALIVEVGGHLPPSFFVHVLLSLSFHKPNSFMDYILSLYDCRSEAL